MPVTPSQDSGAGDDELCHAASAASHASLADDGDDCGEPWPGYPLDPDCGPPAGKHWDSAENPQHVWQ